MEGVVLCSRTNNSCVRHKIEFVDFSSDVVSFKDRASQILELPSGEFELLYCGLSLSDNRKLDYYGIKPGSTVHAIKKAANKDQKIESIGTDKLKQLRRAAVSIIAHKSQRHILEEILKNEDYLEKMIAVTPGLSKDVLALGLVQDIEMFILAASNDRDTLTKIVEAHPAFGHAALHVIATINEETARARPDQLSHSGVVADTAQAYALDRPSDDEDDDEEDMDLNDMNLNPGANQAGQGNAASVITSDFFQRAMMMAAGGALNPPAASVVNQTQLDQLRDMGITDEAVARRALEQSGGDINLALEMIFGDGI